MLELGLGVFRVSVRVCGRVCGRVWVKVRVNPRWS